MGLTDRVLMAFGLPARASAIPPATFTPFDPWSNFMSFNNNIYPLGINQTMPGVKTENVEQSFAGYVQGAYKANGVVFACMLARLQLFTEARFQYQKMAKGRGSDLWGDASLDILEHPWPGGITADLLARAIQDVDLAGNAYLARRPGRIRRMRPDWVTILLGSFNDPEIDALDLDAEVLGYAYHPGGREFGRDPIFLQRDEVAHFAPIPDPIAGYRGMSWLTPIVREIMGDGAATEHKLRYFENGGTPNLVVTLDPAIEREKFEKWIETFEAGHKGVENAYKTMYLGAGASVDVVGSDLKQLDFKLTQGAGETRIAAAAGVPPVIVGLSEGLQAATYSNYGQARRRFADNTMRPLWRNFAGSLETIVRPPGGSRLWYDVRDIAALQEDQKDLAEVHSLEATQMGALVNAGFKPDTVVAAVTSGDFTKLSHTGLYSVQLQPPMPDGPPAIPDTTSVKPVPASPNGKKAVAPGAKP